MKVCKQCGKDQPESEYYKVRAGTRDSTCRTCRNSRKRRRSSRRAVQQRARHRATTELIRNHQAEFDDLYAAAVAEATAEAEELEAIAAKDPDRDRHSSHDGPVRIKPGARRKGQTAADRLDVARCPHCVRSHDRGHVCPVCGAAPAVGRPGSFTVPRGGIRRPVVSQAEELQSWSAANRRAAAAVR